MYPFPSVLWIRIGFNTDRDPPFYLNADPDPDPGSRTNADPVPGKTLKSQKVHWFLLNIIN
jgi:hypothetical protein